MTELLSGLPDWLLRTTALIAVAAVLIQGVIRLAHVRSAWLHRVGWMLVLLQGALVLQCSLEVPWFAASQPDVAVRAVEFPPPLADHTLRAQASDVPPFNNPAAAAAGAGSTTRLTARLGDLLRWTWMLGIVGVAAVGISSYGVLLYLISKSVPARRVWQGEWNRLTRQAGIRREIPLLVTHAVGPLLVLRPTGYCVVVPETQWEELSAAQRLGILRHELAHLQRGDVWKSLVVRLVAVVHWFNPLAWMAVRRFDETAEWACDQRLADSDPQAVPDYARALIHLIAPRRSGVALPRHEVRRFPYDCNDYFHITNRGIPS